MLSAFLWFQIGFFKKWGMEKVVDVDFKPLTYFMDDTQFYGIIGTVNDVSNGGFRHTAFLIKLILGHIPLFEKFSEPLPNGFIELHIITTRSCNCTIKYRFMWQKISPCGCTN